MCTPIRYAVASCAAALLIGAVPAGAQIVVKANDDVNLKLGVLGQFQGDTIDNPGWSIEINLEDTALVRRPFAVVEDRYQHEMKWLRCWTEGARFRSVCAPARLEDALVVFLDWAERAT